MVGDHLLEQLLGVWGRVTRLCRTPTQHPRSPPPSPGMPRGLWSELELRTRGRWCGGELLGGVKSQGFVPCSLGAPSRSIIQDEAGRRELAGPCHQPILTQRQKRLTPAQPSGILAPGHGSGLSPLQTHLHPGATTTAFVCCLPWPLTHIRCLINAEAWEASSADLGHGGGGAVPGAGSTSVSPPRPLPRGPDPTQLPTVPPNDIVNACGGQGPRFTAWRPPRLWSWDPCPGDTYVLVALGLGVGHLLRASLVAQSVKNLPAMQDTQV